MKRREFFRAALAPVAMAAAAIPEMQPPVLIDAKGTSIADIERLHAAVDALNRSFETRAVQAVADAKHRGGALAFN